MTEPSALLLSTAGTTRYVRYSAADLAVLMVHHQFPLPVRNATGRSQEAYWDSADLDCWLQQRLARLEALGF